jgi:hypothetical protein
MERHRLLPDVPAVSVTVPGFEAFSWQSFVAPEATPEPVQTKRDAWITTALRTLAGDMRLQAIDYTVAASIREACAEALRNGLTALGRGHPAAQLTAR